MTQPEAASEATMRQRTPTDINRDLHYATSLYRYEADHRRCDRIVLAILIAALAAIVAGLLS
jgi:hypothetical protein